MSNYQKDQTIDPPKEEISELFEEFSGYIEATVDVNKMKAAAKVATIGSIVIHKSIGVVILAMVFLLLSVGGAFFLGDVLGEVYYGFFALGGVYLIIAIIFLNSKKSFETKFTNTIIKEIFK